MKRPDLEHYEQYDDTPHYSPEAPVAWDGNELVAVDLPADVDERTEEERDEEERGQLAQEILNGLLRRLTIPGNALLTGQALHVLAFLAGQSDFRTKAELAKSLKLSPARVSQILREIPQGLQSMTKLKRRTRLSSRQVYGHNFKGSR